MKHLYNHKINQSKILKGRQHISLTYLVCEAYSHMWFWNLLCIFVLDWGGPFDKKVATFQPTTIPPVFLALWHSIFLLIVAVFVGVLQVVYLWFLVVNFYICFLTLSCPDLSKHIQFYQSIAARAVCYLSCCCCSNRGAYLEFDIQN